MRPGIKEAFGILEEYVKPNSMVDMGNLYFAGTEYRSAYALLLTRILKHLNNGAISANECLCLIRRDVEDAITDSKGESK